MRVLRVQRAGCGRNGGRFQNGRYRVLHFLLPPHPAPTPANFCLKDPFPRPSPTASSGDQLRLWDPGNMGGAPRGLSGLQGTVLGTGTLQNKGLKREKLKKLLEFSARDRVPDVLSTAELLDCAPSQGKKQ